MEKITKSSDKVLIDPNEPLILPDGTALVGRVEWFLYALCCLDYQNLPTPMSRIEEFANALITDEIPNIQPQSRAEQFFLAILDGNISDLPQPQSRSEVLLDKLARGEFDLSDVEPIQSRYELLLAYLIKNGGIGNIDYVLYEFSEAMKTMYNTVEKPFKSLELSGNTLVNCVLEDTENDDYTSFDKDYSGTSFTINGTSEGAIKSAILKGSTKYRDIDTGEFLETFEEGRNLELVSVKMPVLTTTGKNLNNSKMIFGSINGAGGFVDTKIRNVSADFISVIPNEQYTLHCFDDNVEIKAYYEYDKDKNFIRQFAYVGDYRSFITLSNTAYIKFIVGKKDNSTMDKVAEKISLFKGKTTSESYEPYKSNILSCNEEVELRGVGNVKDELNLVTSELTQRIGEVTFKGALNEGWGQFDNSAIQEKTCLFVYYGGLPSSPKEDLKMLSDKYIIKNGYVTLLNTDEEMVHVYSDRAVYFRVLKSKLSTQNVTGFKEWLSQNPFTIQYQLKTESIKTVGLSIVDQNNTKIDKMHVFNEVTHVNASSDELTPTVNIGKSVSYPTIIKPNTKYTVDLKRNDKPLTVNLGGTEVTFASDETRKTITTPSTLTNDKLSYYGVGAKCNEIMLIEGEIERNVDYFTGMQSVVMQNQMPILSTVGKNLLNLNNYTIRYGVENLIKNDDSFTLDIIDGWGGIQFKDLKLKPNTNYTFKFETNKSEVVAFAKISGQENQGGRKEFTFTTDNSGLVNLSIEATTPTSSIILSNIQLEEGTVTTPYEPHKSSILSLPKEVVLRSLPNEVCDTLDTQTGIYTKRIGEISTDDVINNTTWGKADGLLTSNNIAFYYKENNIKTTSGGSEGLGVIVSDVLPYTNRDSLMQDIEGIATLNKNIIFKILKSKLPSSLSVDDFKRWLKANPITIQYELANPIIKTVDLNVVDQDGNTIPKIKSYKDVTHLEVTVPKQSLLPHISAEVATDNSKDMSSLTTKHQEISETQSAIQDNIQSQSDEIDTALMATTEIFESILE